MLFATNTAKEKTMSTYKFAEIPAPSSIVGTVTLLVSAWFMVAAGALLTDSHSDMLLDEIRAQRTAAMPYDTHTTIVVEATRADARS